MSTPLDVPPGGVFESGASRPPLQRAAADASGNAADCFAAIAGFRAADPAPGLETCWTEWLALSAQHWRRRDCRRRNVGVGALQQHSQSCRFVGVYSSYVAAGVNNFRSGRRTDARGLCCARCWPGVDGEAI